MDSKISIVIPVGNVSRYLRQCLDSVLAQSLREIEVIAIDDASTDGSRDILEEYVRRDGRLRLLYHATNRSASQARKNGVVAATGDYIMFLDGDDFLDPSACERLYREICLRRVEMLQFDTHVIDEGHLPRARIENMMRFLRPLGARLEGEEVFTACFREKKFGYTIWNKIYAAELCKRAFEHIPAGSFPKAQDILALFILAFFARSYEGLPGERYYFYRAGAGLTGKTSLSLERLAVYCTQKRVAEAIQNFLEAQGALERYREVQRSIHDDLLFECVWNWLRHLAPQDQGRGFDMLIKSWGGEAVASCLAWSKDNDAMRQALHETRLNLKTVENSLSYRLGRALTAGPRKLSDWLVTLRRCDGEG